MTLPFHKTKIVATIGPACESPEILAEMIRAGMNIARLNLSHGDFASHGRRIGDIRRLARDLDRRVAIMGDLPGPKIRIGDFADEPVLLAAGDPFTLTTEEVVGDAGRVSVTLQRLPEVVQPGTTLFLNDGFIELLVEKIAGPEVQCRVVVGGELRSRKGLNLPGIDLGISAFTDHDRHCLEFLLDEGVDAVSQSFVESAADLAAVRNFAAERGGHPFVIAKLERPRPWSVIAEIVAAADGVMVARGDLGVETPIAKIAVTQKRIILMANRLGRPVITATQMLESMIDHRRPTRAESTDVANAILDGTDAVMLSGESAMGRFPVEAVRMLASIAASTEPYADEHWSPRSRWTVSDQTDRSPKSLVAQSVALMVEKNPPVAIFIPTRSGSAARRITRYRLPVWITAVSAGEDVCQHLNFSYGIYPVHEAEYPDNWDAYTDAWLAEHGIDGELVLLAEGPSEKNPAANNKIVVIERRDAKR